jgi:hypothetical protein
VVSRNIRPFDPAPPFPFLPAFSRSHLFMKVSNKDANGSKINFFYIQLIGTPMEKWDI